jgi:hypothetical protein
MRALAFGTGLRCMGCWIFKEKNQKEQFAFDSGIRLNLVTDYFELYLPVYSPTKWTA